MTTSPFVRLLKDRIDLRSIPFSERGSRILVFHQNDYLSIRLAERWYKLTGLLTADQTRPPLLDQVRFTDEAGHRLDYTITTYPHCLEFQTSLGVFRLVFVDAETMLVTLPPVRCGLTFQANLDQGQIDRRGGVLRLTGNIRRNVAYTTNARLLQNALIATEGQGQMVALRLDATAAGRGLLLNITPRLGFNRVMPNTQDALEQAAQRWHDWFAAAPEVLPEYQRQYYYAWWVMRAGLISTRFYITREAMMPSKTHYVGVWQWDAFFHALAYRHVNMHLAKDQLRIVLDHQREDGMIPDAVHDEGTITRLTSPVEADVTKPPLLAWTAWQLFEQDGDIEFLDEIYGAITRWNNWWFEHNDVDHNGLCEYQHPNSSGLDNSPLWDEGMPVEAPDLNTYLCLQQEAMAKIARVIGEDDEAQTWEQRAEAMAERMLRHMWDPVSGLFWARRSTVDARVNVRTPFSLFPLITGRMPPEVAERLVAHLTDERQFWTRFPVPTVARDDPKYTAHQMWRGPTWVNVNYLLIEGLHRSGFHSVAHELRRRTLEMMMHGTDIYEYYNADTGEPPPSAASVFGWSSALFIELALQATRNQHPDAA